MSTQKQPDARVVASPFTDNRQTRLDRLVGAVETDRLAKAVPQLTDVENVTVAAFASSI